MNWENIGAIERSDDVPGAEEFRNQCVERLRCDKELYDSGRRDEISDCAVYMPRPGGQLDKERRTAHKLARALFPDIGDHEDEKIKTWGVIQYSKLISTLSAAVRERKNREAAARAKPNKKLIRDHCILRNRSAGLSNAVINPEPMPVEESPLSELEPVIAALASGSADFGDADMVEYTRGVIFRDGRLDLCKQVLGRSHIEKVIDAMRGNQAVKHFLLGNNISGMPCAEAVARHLVEDRSPHIQTWYLAGNELDSDAIAVLADGFRVDSHATGLWLKRNPVRAPGARSLGEMLRVNTTLRTLDLLNTGLMDNGAEELFTLLRENTGLRNLYVDANGLTPASASSIAAYFEALVSEGRMGVTRIWLGMNCLGDEGVAVILRAMKNYRHLLSVNVNSNRLTAASGKELYEAFRAHPLLCALDCGSYKATLDMGVIPNNIKDDGAEWLAKLLADNRAIQVLHVFENELTDAGLHSISSALERNPRLLSLGYGQTGVRYDKAAMGSITTSLRRNIAANEKTSGRSDKELKQLFRELIHGEEIRNIDSIYRNRAMKGE